MNLESDNSFVSSSSGAASIPPSTSLPGSEPVSAAPASQSSGNLEPVPIPTTTTSQPSNHVTSTGSTVASSSSHSVSTLGDGMVSTNDMSSATAVSTSSQSHSNAQAAGQLGEGSQHTAQSAKLNPATTNLPYAAVVAGAHLSANKPVVENSSQSQPSGTVSVAVEPGTSQQGNEKTSSGVPVTPNPETNKTRSRSGSQLSKDALPYSPSYMSNPATVRPPGFTQHTPIPVNLASQFATTTAPVAPPVNTGDSNTAADITSAPPSTSLTPSSSATPVAPLTLVPAALIMGGRGHFSHGHNSSLRQLSANPSFYSPSQSSPMLSPKVASNAKPTSHIAQPMDLQPPLALTNDQTAMSCGSPRFTPLASSTHAMPTLIPSASTSPILGSQPPSRPASGTVSPAVGAQPQEKWRTVGAYRDDSETSESFDEEDSDVEKVSPESGATIVVTKKFDPVEEAKRSQSVPSLGISMFGSSPLDSFGPDAPGSSLKARRFRRILKRIPIERPAQPQPQTFIQLPQLRVAASLSSPSSSDAGFESPQPPSSSGFTADTTLASPKGSSSSCEAALEPEPTTTVSAPTETTPQSTQEVPYKVHKVFENDINTEFDYLIVLDLEATCDAPSPDGRAPSVTRETQEIIEFPWILFDVKAQKIIETERRFVKPVYSQVTQFCTKLTGITQAEVDARGESLQDVLTAFEKYYYDRFPTFETQRRVALVTDGNWDFKVQLIGEALRKGIRIPRLFRTFTNLQTVFSQFYAKLCVRRKPNLKYMASFLNVELSGHHHTGIDDCHSICSILKAMFASGLKLTRRSLEKVPRTYNPWSDPGIKDFNFTNAGTAAMLGLGSPVLTDQPSTAGAVGSGNLNPLSPLSPLQSDSPPPLATSIPVPQSTLVQLRGLPWNYTDLDIYAFFSGLHIRGGGIIHLMNAQGQPSGSAIVDFATIPETIEALKRNRRLMGHRFIEVTPCSESMINELRNFLTHRELAQTPNPASAQQPANSSTQQAQQQQSDG